MKQPPLTINKAIELLSKARDVMGGDKCLVLSLTDSGLDDVTIDDMECLETYVEVQVKHPAFEGK